MHHHDIRSFQAGYTHHVLDDEVHQAIGHCWYAHLWFHLHDAWGGHRTAWFSTPMMVAVVRRKHLHGVPHNHHHAQIPTGLVPRGLHRARPDVVVEADAKLVGLCLVAVIVAVRSSHRRSVASVLAGSSCIQCIKHVAHHIP